MKIINYIKQLPKALSLFILLFLLSFIAYFYIQTQYIQKSEENYINVIHNEVQLLIDTKKMTTFSIAQRLAIDKKLIDIMKNKEYKKLYDGNIFRLAKKFKIYKHLWLHVVDKNGVNRYLSWADKNSKLVGKNILNQRTDLKILFKKPHSVSVISVGIFDITFKGIMPIYDGKHRFLGIVEVISHFNSIAKGLEKDGIYSALVIEKRFTKQLTHPFSKVFIDGYNISTLRFNKDVKKILEKSGINSFIKGEETHETGLSTLIHHYFVTKVDIVGVNNDIIGYYIVFIKDKQYLELKEILLQLLTALMGMLFLFMTFFGFRVNLVNKNLIDSLAKRVKEETDKNLSLIYNDGLTKCYSKEKFLADTICYTNKEFVMLNIKNFSQINATYGFNIGDEILKLSATRLQKILERKIYRIDSDEFVFISDEISDDIECITHHFNDDPLHVTTDDISIRISFSFSVVYGSDNDPLRKLSLGIKQAKFEPYKLFTYYKEQNINNEFIKFNAYLYDAIFAQQDAKVVPYFQGIYNNKTGEIIKYEALARLEVKAKIYSPYYFIDIAKNSGFLSEITKIMVDKSFAYLTQHADNISISINITEDDLHSKKLKGYLLEKLAFYHLKPEQIIIEILEGISSSGAKNSIIQLKELKEAGFKLSIDDFGVEYSNFERISELDVDFIKIDGKYIKNIDTSEKSYKIAKAISEFASSMNINVIAEFVENEAIQKIIEEIGIEFSQGYHFSVPAPDFIE